MTLRLMPLVLVLAASGSAPAQDADWALAPSLYVFGSLERGQGESAAVGSLAFPPAGPAAGVAGSLDAGRRWEQSEVDIGVFGSVRRHWLSENQLGTPDWGWVAEVTGRGGSTLSPNARLWLADSVRAERVPGLGELRRNQVEVGVETAGDAVGFSVGLRDRRRAVTYAPELGFAQQGLRLGSGFSLSPRQALSLETELQFYQADTARGQRLLVSGEHSRIGKRGVTALRVAWWEPLGETLSDSRLGDLPDPGPIVPAIERSDLLDGYTQPVTQPIAVPEPAEEPISSHFVGDALFLDSALESDVDEWDYGRRKLLLVAFWSGAVHRRISISSMLWLQRRSGPDLLTWDPEPPSFTDTRIRVRLIGRVGLARSLGLMLHASHLQSISDEADYDFSRGFLAVGLHWTF